MLCLTTATLVALLQTASTPVPASVLTHAPAVRATRATAPPVLDGDLGDPAWGQAAPVSGFLQRDPDEGAPATERTEVRVLFDDAAMYVGARLYDSAPQLIEGRLARRDNQVTSDRFYLYLDTYHDRRTGFFFGVNAAGTLYDGTMSNDEWDDDTWDGIWDARVGRDSLGWTVEMRIPYSQLRFSSQQAYEWGINFRRDVARKNEVSFLAYKPKAASGFVSRFPTLSGIERIRPPKRMEIVPYITSKAEFLDHPAGDPFNDGSRMRAAVGADLKLGLGSNLTLDATVNPDFGQVEVDPAVVNLSDAETFYPEKRPFFIEGANIFDFGSGGANNFWGFNWPGADFFYSRRIGRAPQGSVPDADFQDLPQNSTILGAGKLSGKVGAWNVGALEAVTDREHAHLATGGTRQTAEVEPLTSYSLLRAQRDFGAGAQGLGLIATATVRDFKDPALSDQLNHEAYSVGLDGWTFLDSGRMWVLTGYTGASRVSGTTARLLRLQQNSTHYFQRPDAGYLEVDSGATSLGGWTSRVWLNKQRGDWLVNAGLGAISPGLEVNDMGFGSRSDVVNGHTVVSRRWSTPGRVFRFARVNLGLFRSYDFGGNRTADGLWLSGGTEFKNYHGFDGYFNYNAERLSNRRTRGGPLTVTPGGYQAQVSYYTDDRKPVVLQAAASRGAVGRGEEDTWGVNASIQWKPAPAVSLSFEPEVEWSTVGTQYIGTYADPLATATFGARYVFGTIDQTTLASSVRLNWTFSPALSLELYAQPLFSSGNFRQFKELRRSRSYDFLRYGTAGSTLTPTLDAEGAVTGYDADPDGAGPAGALNFSNPDFNLASLRGNAVLRWEYHPGSVLYLVWTQDRSAFMDEGDFRLSRSLSRLVNARGNHIVAVKLTYWWHP